MTLKEHLQQVHQHDAEHHAIKAAKMHELSDHFGVLAAHHELTSPADAKSHADISACFKAIAETHTTRGEQCLEEHKSAGALATSEIQGSGGESSDLKVLAGQVGALVKYLADPTSRVSPNPMFPARPTLIPRFGAQDPTAVVNKVDESLRRLISEEDETGT